jgi:hypothetical protein
LLPLDPLDLLVEFVRDVKVDIIEGDVNLALAAASTSL